MGKIKQLPAEVVDQIAAGEVVERPAHMVKELLENAVDAGATEIELEFDQGGKHVRLTDNGSGMTADDLRLCFDRHATSKIAKADDLWALDSFGFRGEALASISSVSLMTITSKTSNCKTGHKIESEFGVKTDVLPTGTEVGTSIEVQRLFENTPARLKFLKSDTAEHTQIKNIVKAVAMANPEIGFRVRHKSKLLFMWPATDQKSRCEQVLDFSPLYEGESEVAGIKAKVYIGAPNKTVKTARNIWSFVQGRYVQDRSLQAAVMDAYRSLLMHGEYPVVAAFLQAPPDSVDVNIHPTKSQVKFENASNAFRSVLRACRVTLEEAPWMEHAVKPVQYVETVKFDAPEPVQGEMLTHEPVVYKTKTFAKNLHDSKPVQMDVSLNPTVLEEPTVVDVQESPKGFFGQLQVIGQADLTYIITQHKDKLVIVDQHAAHERVTYERLMRHWNNEDLDIQQFLIPLTIDLEPDQVEAIVQHRGDVMKLGIDVDQAGPETLAVRSAPTLIKEKSLAAALDVLGRELVQKAGSFVLEKTIGDVCATLACHSSVRAGQAFSIEEMESLLEQMDEFPLSSFCPHGRPVYIEYPFSKMERDFGRIV